MKEEWLSMSKNWKSVLLKVGGSSNFKNGIEKRR